MKVYFAGSLFTHKDLAGNAMLADEIGRVSGGKFECLLPQNIEHRSSSPKEIRDADISALLSCDLALFNYDGCELDSGTVVEFMFAKFADIPSVLLRTDFRAGGDSGENPWNLMTSYYPRTETLVLDAAKIYASCDRDYRKTAAEIAGKVVEKLEFLSHTAPAMPDRLRPAVSEWLSKLPSA